MKKIGLIGGMSWESTQVYYRIMNERVREILGGYHSVRCVMDSVDFAEIERLQHEDRWDLLSELMAHSAQNLVRAEAELIVICTNTMHACTSYITRNADVPLLHIASATGGQIKTDGLDSILLLGTRFTMEGGFYKDTLREEFGIQTLVPEATDRERIHRIIYQELVHGVFRDESRENIREIIRKGAEKGAQGVVLGCTEIPLLLRQGDVDIAVYDTTRIHAEAAVDFALG